MILNIVFLFSCSISDTVKRWIFMHFLQSRFVSWLVTWMHVQMYQITTAVVSSINMVSCVVLFERRFFFAATRVEKYGASVVEIDSWKKKVIGKHYWCGSHEGRDIIDGAKEIVIVPIRAIEKAAAVRLINIFRFDWSIRSATPGRACIHVDSLTNTIRPRVPLYSSYLSFLRARGLLNWPD